MQGPVPSSQSIPEPVLAAARRHLAGIRPPAGRRWYVPEGRRVEGGWFFVYAAERVRPGRPGTGFGFAPGYVVSDDGSVRTVGERALREVLGSPEGGTEPAEPRAAADRGVECE